MKILLPRNTQKTTAERPWMNAIKTQSEHPQNHERKGVARSLTSFPLYLKKAWAGTKSIKQINLSSLRKVFSLMGKKEKIVLLILLAIAILSLLWNVKKFFYSVTIPAPAFGGSYTEGMVGQPNFINPVLAFQENDLTLTRLVYSSLYKYDSQGNLVPDLAVALPEISEDKKEYKVQIKQNVEWHNRRNLTVDDIIFTVELIKDPNFKSPTRPSWASTNVEKIDDYTVKFITKEVSGPFIHNLTLPILPKSVWFKTGSLAFALSENNLKAIGSGPFAVSEIRKLTSGKIQSISFDSFSNYYAGKPKIDQITIKFYDTAEDLIKALHSKEVQGLGYMPFTQNLNMGQSRENVEIAKIPAPQFQALFFNLNSNFLNQQHARNAIGKLIDRNKISEQAFLNNAKPIDSFLGFFANQAANVPAGADSQTAEELFLAMGFKRNPQTSSWEKNGQPLELRLHTNEFEPNVKAAEIIASDLKAFGITLQLNILPSKQLVEEILKPRSFDLLIFGQKFGADPDPFAFWHSSQIKDPGLNLSGFEDAEADKLITAARTTTDRETRKERYLQLSELLNNRTPAVFLTQSFYTYAYSKDIKGFTLTKLYDPAFRFFDAPNWYIREQRVLK